MAYTAYAAAGRAWAMIVEAVVHRLVQVDAPGKMKYITSSFSSFLELYCFILGVFIFCGGVEGFPLLKFRNRLKLKKRFSFFFLMTFTYCKASLI